MNPADDSRQGKEVAPVTSFGLIVIGDEILNGQRVDKHLSAFKGLLGSRGHTLAWQWTLPDEPGTLVRHLRFSLDMGGPAFVCGGIGATPDDHTRACAATAAGLPLVRHPEARKLLESMFGDQAYPHRILMADLPRGATLIPNPVNRIPGFALDGHWFLPGFPEMAWPMAEWVLDRHYTPGPLLGEMAVEVLDTPESSLIPVMEALGKRFPELKVFSLPHLGSDRHVVLGMRGRGDLAEPYRSLRALLDEQDIPYREAGARS